MPRINLNPRNKKNEKFYSSHNYSNPDAVKKLAAYILNPDKTSSNYTKYYGVLESSPECIQSNFASIASIHKKDMKGRRKAEHFVISAHGKSEVEEMGGIEIFHEGVIKYCEHLAQNHQLVFAIHENTNNLHAHILLNPINCTNGKRLQKNRFFLETEKTYVNSIFSDLKNKHNSSHTN